MAEGKALHKDIVIDGDAFLAARGKLDAVMRTQKLALDKIRLATIEAKEGHKARWHVANVLMTGQVALDALNIGAMRAPASTCRPSTAPWRASAEPSRT